MTRSLAAFAALAVSALIASTPAQAARSRRPKPAQTHNHTRAQGGPSGIGGVPGTRSNQMVRVQQQRAQRGAGRERRMSPRDKLLAARDRQLGVAGGDEVAFGSRREAATYTRMRARVIQIRTFGVALATSIGGGFLVKMVSALGAFESGFRHVEFGNSMAQVLDHNFAIGAVIGAGVSLVVGSLRAAQLRRRADAVERGDVDVDLVRLD